MRDAGWCKQAILLLATELALQQWIDPGPFVATESMCSMWGCPVSIHCSLNLFAHLHKCAKDIVLVGRDHFNCHPQLSVLAPQQVAFLLLLRSLRRSSARQASGMPLHLQEVQQSTVHKGSMVADYWRLGILNSFEFSLNSVFQHIGYVTRHN